MSLPPNDSASYRGRLAPSPTGYLHLGHARTFWMAQERARTAGGALLLRVEDIDRDRCKSEFAAAMIEDLRWFGFQWREGPDIGGEFGPYLQSQRTEHYLRALETLRRSNRVYPCSCTRKDLRLAAQAPHPEDDEPIYPGTCRPNRSSQASGIPLSTELHRLNWRFQVNDGEVVSFHDGGFGLQRFEAGKDFGDFLVWRHDGVPSYQLAVVVDDAAMRITEVVRGADLLRSTARQLLLYRALGIEPPQYFHCPLLTDGGGKRISKRDGADSLRALRSKGATPESLRQQF